MTEKKWLTSVKSVLSDYASGIIEAGDTTGQKVIGAALGIKYGAGYAAAKAQDALAVAQQKATESALGLGYGFTEAGKAVSGAVSSTFTGTKDYFSSIKLWLVIPTLLLVFVVVLVSIGYSGLGGPAARIAEREYGRRR